MSGLAAGVDGAAHLGALDAGGAGTANIDVEIKGPNGLTLARHYALDVKAATQILARRVPGAKAALSAEIVAFVQKLRSLDLYKLPGIAETIEWTRALMELDAMVLDPEVIQHTLGVLLKYQDDIVRMQGSEAARMLEQVRNEARTAGH